jgi:hypothetical protein
MKTFLLCFLSVGFISAASSQNLNLSWAYQFAGPGDMRAEASSRDGSGAIITCGWLEGLADFDPGAGSQILTSNGAKDGYVAKLDANGNYVWAFSLGSTQDDFVNDVATDLAGNVYITGEFRGTVNFNPQGNNAFTAFVGYNAFVAKYSPSGQFLWVRKFGGATSGNESGSALTVDASGNVYSTGRFYGPVDFDPGAGTAELNVSGGYGAYFSALSTDGNFIWARAINGFYTVPDAIRLDNDGNVVSVGTFYSNVDFNPGSGNFPLNGQYYDTYILKLNSLGDFVWARHLSSSSTCLTNSFAFDADNNFYLAGGYNGTTDFDPDLVATQTETNTSGQYRAFLLKLNSAGLYQYHKLLAPSAVGQARSIRLSNNNEIIIGGYFYGAADFDPDPLVEFPLSANNAASSTAEDIFITRFDTEGNFIVANSFGGTSNDLLGSMELNPATGVLHFNGTFSGTIQLEGGNNPVTLTSSGLADAFLVRFTQCSPITNSISASSCETYSFNGLTLTQSGQYTSTITTLQGCDSVITLNLTIFTPSSGSVTLYTNDVIEYNGVIYNSEGTFTQTLENANGCDSILQVTVDIMENNFTPENDNGTLQATQNGVSYQWIDCETNQPIAGANQPTYTPTASGSYSVVVTGNQGSVTSECISVVISSTEMIVEESFQLFPNPASEFLQLQFKGNRPANYSIFDGQGRLVQTGSFTQNQHTIQVSSLQCGLYFLIVQANGIKKIPFVIAR